jgi:hypothetical protein
VFFLTAGPLVKSDVDSALDLYDAHVCGAAGCPQLPAAGEPCSSAEGCRGPREQGGVFAPPATSSPSGQGNLTPPTTTVPKPKPKPLTTRQKLALALKACHKLHTKHKRAVCEKAAHRRYPLKARKSALGHR